MILFLFFQAEDGIRDDLVTGVQTCALPIYEVYICFVDFKKAFDRVDWIKMMEVLESVGVDWRDRRLIYQLYNRRMTQEAIVKIGRASCRERGKISMVEIGLNNEIRQLNVIK